MQKHYKIIQPRLVEYTYRKKIRPNLQFRVSFSFLLTARGMKSGFQKKTLDNKYIVRPFYGLVKLLQGSETTMSIPINILMINPKEPFYMKMGSSTFLR